MLQNGRELIYDRSYQVLMEPATAASDPRVASNVTRRARIVKAVSFGAKELTA
jgi:hypothetical protein